MLLVQSLRIDQGHHETEDTARNRILWRTLKPLQFPQVRMVRPTPGSASFRRSALVQAAQYNWHNGRVSSRGFFAHWLPMWKIGMADASEFLAMGAWCAASKAINPSFARLVVPRDTQLARRVPAFQVSRRSQATMPRLGRVTLPMRVGRVDRSLTLMPNVHPGAESRAV